MDLRQQPKRAEQAVVTARPGLAQRLNALRKRSPLSPYWLERRWLRRAMEGLAHHAAGEMLDVGCGERPYAEFFKPKIRRYWGLEYPPVADNLNPDVWNRPEMLRTVVDVWGDAQRLPFASARFDTVLAAEMLEHIPDPDSCVREIARVVRPGGRLLLTVPLIAPLHQWPFDFYRYTPRGIEALVQRHGFDVEEITPRGNFASATGATLSHWLVRSLAASKLHHDGSVAVSRWRGPFVLPLVAFVQLFFWACEGLSKDTGASLGYSVVARRRVSES
jgi:SAM-dependent methyltransferase